MIEASWVDKAATSLLKSEGDWYFDGFATSFDYTFNKMIGVSNHGDFQIETPVGIVKDISLPTSAQKTAFSQTLQQWEYIIGLNTTNEISPSSNFSGLIVLQADLSELDIPNHVAGLFIPYDTVVSDASVIFVSDTYTATDFSPGSIGYKTFLHEIGHGLGLPEVYLNTFSSLQTVMMSSGTSLTPMIADIKAVQEIYGADTNNNAGNTTYLLDGSDQVVMQGSSGTHIIGGSEFPTLTVWDSSGSGDVIDTQNYSGSQQVLIDLREGSQHYSAVGDVHMHIAYGSNIENAKGSNQTDIIYGNEYANSIEGNDGNDLIYGDDIHYSEGEDDTLLGNAGNDLLYGHSDNDSLNGGSDDDGLLGGEGNDTLDGGEGNDKLLGGMGNDTIFGGSGDSSIGGGEGADIIYGYTDPSVTGTPSGPVDMVTAIYGGDGNDTIYSSPGMDFIQCGNGSNRVNFNGYFGYDFIDGDYDDRIYIGGLDISGEYEVQDYDEPTPTDISPEYYGFLSNGYKFQVEYFPTDVEYDLRIWGPNGDIVIYDWEQTYFGIEIDLDEEADEDVHIDYGESPTYERFWRTYSELEDLEVNPSDYNSSASSIKEGTSYADSISGSSTSENISYGYAGNDTIGGSGSAAFADSLFGGDGTDSLSAGAGNDFLSGDAGNDTLIGGTGDDTYRAETGDTVTESSGEGTDTIQTSASSLTLSSNVENLTILGTSNLNGTGNSLANSILGNTGNNALAGDAGNDTLEGNDGADSIEAGDGNDSVTGGSGNDFLSGGPTSAADGDDTLEGGDGDDYITAKRGNDVAYGGAGNDTIYGDYGSETISGNDALSGGDGNDSIFGYGGNDTIEGGAGADSMDADGGTADILSYATSDAAVTVDISTNSVSGGHAASDTVSNFEGVIGSDYDDTITGTTGANSIDGGGGDDSITAGNSNDTIHAGFGDDISVGSTGTDAMYLEEGNDTLSAIFSEIGTSDTFSGGTGVDTYNAVYANQVLLDLTSGSWANFTGFESFVLGGNTSRITVAGGYFDDADFTGDILTVDGQLLTATTLGFYGSGISASHDHVSVRGGSLADTITAGAGNDTIEGGAGADSLTGGSGSDTLSYANSSAAISFVVSTQSVSGGHAASDTVSGFENAIGSAYVDTITGDGGSSTIEGGASGDSLDGGSGTDTLSYASSNAGVTLSLATHSVSGGHGASDTITGFENAVGSSYGDSITGSTGDNLIYGGAGNDTLIGGSGNDTLYGGEGDDLASAATNTDAMYLEYGNDTVSAAFSEVSTSDTYSGGMGLDTFNHLLGGSVVAMDLTSGSWANFTGFETFVLGGNTSRFTVSGGYFDDADFDGEVLSVNGSALTTTALTFIASAVTDAYDSINILGGTISDTITGGAGSDTIEGAAGGDSLTGGGGIDLLSYATSSAAVSVNLSTNSVSGGHAGSDTVTGFEGVIGSGYADTLTGSSGDNVFLGGAGVDSLTGGSGADSFVYTASTQSGTGSGNRDIIADFNQAQGDTVDLSPLVGAFSFIGTSAFDANAATIQIRYSQTGGNTIVEIDSDSVSGANFEIQLTGLITLAEGDFVL